MIEDHSMTIPVNIDEIYPVVLGLLGRKNENDGRGTSYNHKS